MIVVLNRLSIALSGKRKFMREISVDLGKKSYPIFIGEDLLANTSWLESLIASQQVMIVTNTTIEQLYLAQLKQSISKFKPAVTIIPDGESFKTLGVMNKIITGLLESKFSRDSYLIALGGGVVGDMTGFAAACYQRGISYIQIPTTLLAQVDSSVGGKTAVNHELGKNMIGAFHQPAAVISDTDVLKTLPDRELIAGLAEVIKYGLIRDSEFFFWLETNMEKLLERDADALTHVIERSCINKAEVVAQDEKESGLRAILNLGHSFGHAIETAKNYNDWLHGEAVATGMLMAADLSCRLGWLDKESVDRVRSLLERAALPVRLPTGIEPARMRELMSIDKKAKQGKLFLILLKGIGQSIVTSEFETEPLKETLSCFPSVATGDK